MPLRATAAGGRRCRGASSTKPYLASWRRWNEHDAGLSPTSSPASVAVSAPSCASTSSSRRRIGCASARIVFGSVSSRRGGAHRVERYLSKDSFSSRWQDQWALRPCCQRGERARCAPCARRIVILVFDGVQALDVTGPAEVVLDRRPHRARQLHAWRPSRRGAGRWRTSGGADARTPTARSRSCRGPIDTLLVAGGTGVRGGRGATPRLMRWIAPRGPPLAPRRLGLHRRVPARRGRACSTAAARPRTGRACAALARRYPAVRVEPDPIFVRDGDVWTSAGVTAGMDLALALVEEDLGPRGGARRSRAGSCCSSSGPAARRSSARSLAAQRGRARAAARAAGAGSPTTSTRDLSVPALAERAHMSERNFARAFRARSA